MASPRRSANSVERALADALDAAQAQARSGSRIDAPSVTRPESGVERLAAQREPGELWLIAYSGGMDSTVLLHAALRVAGADNIIAVHVHHGLQPAANAWQSHCEAQARAFGVAFEFQRLTGPPRRGLGVEAWAREQRYKALAGVALARGAAAVLTAHHADDQVETVLMRIARGTGIDGLGGIAECTTLFGARVLRPLLGLPRAQLAAYARANALRSVEDPSNADARRTRNAIRHRVLPAIDAALPGFRARLLEALPLLRAARDAQAVLAGQDLSHALSGASLDRRVLSHLSIERRNAALREWLRSQGLRAPSRARLHEMGRQLIESSGADGRVLHEGVALLRHRDTIVAYQPFAHEIVAPARTELSWRGERSIELPGNDGRLRFVAARAGAAGAVGERWLSAQTLVVSAGEAMSARLRPHPLGRRRTLKNLYQERGIPAWIRATLPQVHANGQLLYAGGIGMDCDPVRADSGACIAMRWEPATATDPRWAWCVRDEG